MSKALNAMPASFISSYVGYLNDRGCDVIQILNPGGYLQTIVYNEPKNIIIQLRAAVRAETNAIRNMLAATDEVIKALDTVTEAVTICYNELEELELREA